MEKRHYTFQGADFLLEPISDSVIRVTHVDQVGYVGMSPVDPCDTSGLDATEGIRKAVRRRRRKPTPLQAAR